eukprot:scaffold21958_cov24-Prasinocladus_malaysianus.AAC.1
MPGTYRYRSVSRASAGEQTAGTHRERHRPRRSFRSQQDNNGIFSVFCSVHSDSIGEHRLEATTLR